VKLEGVTIVKFSKDLLADMRSIKLTETINSLNCKYFLLTLTAFEAQDGEEFDKWSSLESIITNSSIYDERRLTLMRNTLVSQPLSI